MIIEQLFLVTYHKNPAFTIAHIPGSNNLLQHFHVFLSKSEAQAWVKFQKKTTKCLKFRVAPLNPEKMEYMMYSSGKFLTVTLLGTGDLWSDFKKRYHHCQVKSFDGKTLTTLTNIMPDTVFALSAPNSFKVMIPENSPVSAY